jgi:DNA-binding winged helix-turn-helix (wHTH) protein/predicted ATPase
VYQKPDITFGPFRLDLINECLWQGSQSIALRPKAFAVFNYLLGHPGKLITKEELLEAVWPETFVGDAVLKVAIRQLREALDDDPKVPRFIETAHRRGYRFIGQVTERRQPLAGDRQMNPSPLSGLAPPTAALSSRIVGRDAALSHLYKGLEKTLAGERQVIFVTGEAGIGKTTLIDTFGRGIAEAQNIRLIRGQCLEQYGTSEAYLPVLEAIGQLCRGQQHLVEVLRTHAPMWLSQLPSLMSGADRELLNREIPGATRERMLREMCDALLALTEDAPLVLILEDLHWSDYSTVDLISYLARQREPAQLMVIGTYRTAELIVSRHPLKAVKQELFAKRQCEEIQLEYLSEPAIVEYLSARFPGNRFPAKLSRLIHERTEGNPLFMVNAVDYLVTEGLLGRRAESWELLAELENVEVGVPDSIKQMIEKQLEHLDSKQQRTLEAASVAGAEFSALTVAAGLADEVSRIDIECEELARRSQFIEDRGIQELPNGEVVSRYGFTHALYRNVLYDRLSASRRVQLHRQVGEAGEQLYGERARENAAELAMHFELGANYKQAIKYLRQAADNAIRRFAYREAVGLARQGLELLKRHPDIPEAAEEELRLQLTLGFPLIATEGYATPAVGQLYLRAHELCRQLGETANLGEVAWGLWTFYIVKAELAAAHKLAEEILHLAERLPLPGLAMRGHVAMGVTLVHRGESALSLTHFEKARALYDPERHRDDPYVYSQNPGVAMRSHAAWALWFLGKPEQALNLIQEAVTLAHELAEPHGLAHALYFMAILYHLRSEERLAQEYAEAAIAVATEHGLGLYEAFARIVRSWALLQQGPDEAAIEAMRRGIAGHRSSGAEVARPHLLALLAEAVAKTGRCEEGLQIVEEALQTAHQRGEGSYLAELYRVKGELLLLHGKGRGDYRAVADYLVVSEAEMAQAECCFYQALTIAREQQAKSWEIRAVTSLSRLYLAQRKTAEAKRLLAPVYESFTEGLQTADLREAKALLDELSRLSAVCSGGC